MSSASSAGFTVHTPASLQKQYDAMRKYLIEYHLKTHPSADKMWVNEQIKKLSDIDLALEMSRVEGIKTDETRKQQREQMKKHLTEYYSDSDSPEHNELLASLDRMSFDDLVDLNRVVEQEENTEALLNSFGGKRTLRRKQKVVRKSKKRSGHKRSGHKRSGHKRSGHKRSGHKKRKSGKRSHRRRH